MGYAENQVKRGKTAGELLAKPVDELLAKPVRVLEFKPSIVPQPREVAIKVAGALNAKSEGVYIRPIVAALNLEKIGNADAVKAMHEEWPPVNEFKYSIETITNKMMNGKLRAESSPSSAPMESEVTGSDPSPAPNKAKRKFI